MHSIVTENLQCCCCCLCNEHLSDRTCIFKVKRAKKITMANPTADYSPSDHEVCPVPLANANSPSYARRCWPTLHLVPVVQFLHDNTSLCRAILYSIMSVWVRLELSMNRDLWRWVLCWWCGNFVCCYSHAVQAIAISAEECAERKDADTVSVFIKNNFQLD